LVSFKFFIPAQIKNPARAKKTIEIIIKTTSAVEIPISS
jgi:hypothetical protein